MFRSCLFLVGIALFGRKKKLVPMEAEELEAVSSVYCEPNEFALITHDQGNTVFLIRLPIDDEENRRIAATFTVSPKSWDVSFQDAQFTRASLSQLKEALCLWRSPDTSVWDAFNWIRDNAAEYLRTNIREHSQEVLETDTAILIQLDHLRDVKKYARTLSSICQSLCVRARLLFGPQGGPLVVARGGHGDVREFLKALRTRCVDVDSKGAPCKEKMARVLSQGPVGLSERGEQEEMFDVIRCTSSEELRANFESMGLQNFGGIV